MSDVDEIKSRLNIVDVIGERVTLKKAGRNFKALCPFHAEKTPSFMVSADRQIFKCFGCGKGGSVIDFVMEYDHVDFLEALEQLAQKAGVKLERKSVDTPQAKLKQKIYEVNHLASEYYQYLLTKHRLGERARVYLQSRKITDKSVKTFGLGYSANSWDALSNFLKKKGYDGGLLEQSGLVIPSAKGGYDRFRGRLMFTLRDHRGNIVGFAGRVLDPAIKEAKYINTSETPVYVKSNVLYGIDVTKQAIQKENEAVIMEGELDVISSFQAGISNAVAIKGSALTEGHVRLLRRYTERLAFALDSDMAGDAAARRGIEIAESAGFDMRVVILPQGKDPDDAARESPGLLKKAIKDSVPIYDYYIQSACTRFDPATAFGKRKVADELLPILAKIENPIVQGHYIRALAKALDVTEEHVADGIRKTERFKPGIGRKPEADVVKPATGRQEKLEMFILALLLQGKTGALWDDIVEQIPLSDVASVAVRKILERLKIFLEKQLEFVIKDFADSLPKELVTTLDDALLWDVSDLVENEEIFNREWMKALLELRRLVLRAKMGNLTKTLKSEPDGKASGYQKIHIKQKELTEELKKLEK
ncbi:DNA primase [Patescibacteria group bacterium]|nr:DNA primase [Patescibacteria group bacterium]MBU1473148.1 DNA primase [Patescibacteria group bacterium]MBU2459539.1 DNA primase [Patescibacteria group bacterium]MBU2544535.1 DNA primase [Patescibacteria group bacterium]